jgi:hypothetical protein
MMEQEPATTVQLSRADAVVLLAGAPASGLVLGMVLFDIAAWSGEHVPLFRGPLKVITAGNSDWTGIVWAGLGAALGIAFAFAAFAETLTVTVTDHQVQLRRQRVTTTIPLSSVAVAFLDRQQLVLLGQHTQELFRQTHGSNGKKIAAAFRQHAWPWADADPYSGTYQRWVPDLPALHPAIHALLAARARALEKNDIAEAADLRLEVARLGYVLRDEQNRQYWRSLALPQDGFIGGP